MNMGCAMQEQQSHLQHDSNYEQQESHLEREPSQLNEQQNNDIEKVKPINGVINNNRSEYLMCSRLRAKGVSTQINKVSQLKESHSALVKILESAPIQQQQQQNQPQTVTITSEELLSSASSSPSLIEKKSWLELQATNDQPLQRFQSHNYQNHLHRKRNKQNLVDDNCDNIDKSSEDDDDFGSSNCNSSASSITSEIDTIYPWKKTRIAREWRQQHQITETEVTNCKQSEASVPSSDESANPRPIYNNNNDNDNIDNNTFDEDDEGENIGCECHNNWRRISSDSNDTQNDSGCDSDCPENISELCKKFNENLSEQDVIIFII